MNEWSFSSVQAISRVVMEARKKLEKDQIGGD
jgi:hypothetical protein